MLKKTLKHPENTNKTCFEAFWEILENPVLGSKMWLSAHISNYAKIPWNTQKAPTKHVLRLFIFFFENPVLGEKIRFSAQMSNYAKNIFWNTQKTPTNHALRHFKKFLKIRFLAEKSGSRLICRIMLKYHETLRKHQLNMFWGFLRNSWKSGSRLKNPVSAQISNYAKIPWNTQKTPTKHVLRLLKKFVKIRFSAQTSGSRLRCRTMLKYLETQKTPTKHVLRLLKKFVKIRFSAQTSGSRLRCRTMLKIPWNSENTNLTCFEAFWEILENLVLC